MILKLLKYIYHICWIAYKILKQKKNKQHLLYLMFRHFSARCQTKGLIRFIAYIRYLFWDIIKLKPPNAYFDPIYYATQVRGLDPVYALPHWLTHGINSNFRPNIFFDTKWYREEQLYGVTGTDPLLHFIEYRSRFDLKPHPHFDEDWYRTKNPDVAHANIDPYLHFISHGFNEGRLPNPLYDNDKLNFLVRAKDIKWQSGRSRLLSRDERLRGVFIGKLRTITHDQDTKPTNATCLKDVEVIAGTRILLAQDDKIYADEWSQTFKDPTITQKYHSYIYMTNETVSIEYDLIQNSTIACGIHAMAEADANYFHLFTEVLPRLFGLISTVPENVPLLVSEGSLLCSPQISEILNLGNRQIIILKRNVLYHVNSLIWFPEKSRILDIYSRKASSDELSVDQNSLLAIRKAGLDLASIDLENRKKQRKIYIVRGKRTRQLVNEGEIIEFLSDEGFEIIEIEKLSLKSQIKLFFEASVIVGPTGAAFTNLLWCSSGAKAFILYSDLPQHQFGLWDLVAETSGVEVKVLTGPAKNNVDQFYAIHDDFEISVDLLKKNLMDVSCAEN